MLWGRRQWFRWANKRETNPNNFIPAKAIVAVDTHANHQLGVCGIPEVHTSQRILVGQIHIGVGVQRSLSAARAVIVRAMARGAVGAEQRINSLLESFQRSLLVETHFRGIGNTLYVGPAASARKL